MTGGAAGDDRVLDNLAWHALTGPQADLVGSEVGPQGGGARALRYRREIGSFCAVDRLDRDGWSALADLVGPGRAAVLFRRDIPGPPEGWVEVFREPTVQYVADGLAPPPAAVARELVTLGSDDAADMVELTGITKPGPFNDETWRTGTYLGLREGGRLVAMAGERLRAPGWGEVSAVCVHPSVRGRGLGAALTLAAAEVIVARGDRAMLHVRRDNDPAHRIYARIGFEVRCDVLAAAYRWMG